MSSRNDETGVDAGSGMIMVGVFLLMTVLFVVLCVIAFVLTIFSILAWEKPLKIWKMTVTPEEARIFMSFAAAGAVSVPFVAFALSRMWHFEISPIAFRYLLIGGYSMGGVVVGGMVINSLAKAAPEVLPPMQVIRPEATASLHRPEKPEFEFARWNDLEDE